MWKYIVIISLSLIACKDDSAFPEKVNGYRYIKYTDTGNPYPEPGQVVVLDLELINDKGEILDDSKNSRQTPSVFIPEKMTPELKYNPILCLISNMGQGDSAMIHVPIDSLKTAPEHFRTSAYIDYRIKVHMVVEADEYKRNLEDRNQAMDDRGYALAEPLFNAYKEGALDVEPKSTPSGALVYVTTDTGNQKPQSGDAVEVDYYGFFKDGKSFDNSFKAGRPFKFVINQSAVIRGWHEALPLIPRGGTAIVEIPYELAYGADGSPPVIPPYSDLIFYIKLRTIN